MKVKIVIAPRTLVPECASDIRLYYVHAKAAELYEEGSRKEHVQCMYNLSCMKRLKLYKGVGLDLKGSAALLQVQ